MAVESGLSERLILTLDYAVNDLSASFRLDLIWLRDKYRRRGALDSREYAVALVVLLDELADDSLRRLTPKLCVITGEIPPEQMGGLADTIVERYRECIDQIITTVIKGECVEHGLALPLDRVAARLADHVRRAIRSRYRCL